MHSFMARNDKMGDISKLSADDVTGPYDVWTAEEIKMRKDLISSQPWFGDHNGIASDDTGMGNDEGQLQNLREAGLLKDDDQVCNDEHDSTESQLEYVSEDVCEAMRKESAGIRLEQEADSSFDENVTEIEFLEPTRCIDNCDETIDMVKPLNNVTVEIVDHRCLRDRLEFVSISSVSDLVNAIENEAVVVPSLPVAVANFLALEAFRFVEGNRAAGKRLEAALQVFCSYSTLTAFLAGSVAHFWETSPAHVLE